LLRPLLFRLPPETAHELVLHSLSRSPKLAQLLVGSDSSEQPFEELKRFGLTFSNPIGLAAGFDKDGIALPSLAALGFGFIEAGTVTYHAQPGNERPRLFRLPQDRALINRVGFNNHGAESFARRVQKARPNCILGVSIGKSRIASLEEAVEDYLKSFKLVHSIADYIAVNVSSPNTPGLRSLQQADQLEQLLRALQSRNKELSGTSKPRPLLVKLSPDLDLRELEQIVAAIRNANIAGIIATNTTTTRNGLRTSKALVEKYGEGGLSGAPLQRRSNQMLAQLYRVTNGTIPLIGVGGIFNAEDAWEKICAGASLVQLYTGFIYEGPGIVSRINAGLKQIMETKGFNRLDDAIGNRAKEYK
jgi:dihydroorotate dehydrogenase